MAADVLVSRPDIARLAGVKRPAVTNWERRYPEYPAPVGGDPELFRSGEVLAWLSTRTIPANALLPDEPAGTTYGDRFRAGLPGGTAGGLLRLVERLAGPEADRLRGPMPLDRYLQWLLFLVMVRIVEGAYGLAKAVAAFDMSDRDHDFPSGVFPRDLFTELSGQLDRTPTGSEQEARAAFDHVLVVWRAAYAREGGAFLTPSSVGRVMAGALAAVRPGAVRVHDPYARTGELLVAHLDAVAVGGGGPSQVGGRVPGPEERMVAGWNLRVHHGRAVAFGEGPVTPALDDADPPGAFDVLLTNPPFGRLLEDVAPPSYWTYGPVRRTEFDWLQYAVSRLAPDGRAAVLMPAGAASNTGAAEKVRGGLVEAGVVECVIALPAGLFTLTAVKTHIWLLRAPGSGGTPVPAPEVLFVAGEHLGHQVSRTQQALSDDDVARLVGEYVSWHEARESGAPFPGTPGLSRSVPVPDIVAHGHGLDPVSWIRPPGPAQGGKEAGTVDFRDRLDRLTEEIEALHKRAREADAEAARRLRRYGL
ncbi:HsdM family class I SAM-dependent methyltransferase [Streptomyces graminilatus]|uniref:HsdM family class I SAM-dependent methyltransferase n=1 Tax=Streptomyces graminilatus TaxID=1464070 RepID=UPI0006E302B3|nr:N-6 DNA methylase [Streptomyces graminilatus]